MFLFEIGSNFFIKAAPFEKLRFFGRRRPRKTQLASHLLPREPEVRLREAQSTTNVVQPIFCISPKAKLLNFQEESDNFSRECAFAQKRYIRKSLQPCWTSSIIAMDTNSELHGFLKSKLEALKEQLCTNSCKRICVQQGCSF